MAYECEDMDNLYVAVAEGRLSQDMAQVWVTPGETYQVTVHVTNPFMEILSRQVRRCETISASQATVAVEPRCARKPAVAETSSYCEKVWFAGGAYISTARC